MSVRRLLAIVFALIVVGLTARAWLVSRALGSVEEQARLATQREAQDTRVLASVTALVADLDAGVWGFALTREQEFRASYDQAMVARDTALAALSARFAGNTEGRHAADEVARQLRDWDREIAQPMLRGDAPSGLGETQVGLHREGKRRMDAIRALLARVGAAAVSEHEAQLNAIESRHRAIWTGQAASLAAYMMMIVLAWIITTRRIARPITELAAHARGTSERAPPEIRGVREVVELSRAVGAMTERLKAKRTLLDTTVGAVAEGLFVFDEAAVCILANPAARDLLGYDVVGKDATSLRELLSSTPLDDAGPDGGTHRGTLHRITHATGEERIISVRATALPNGGGVVSARDVTAEHELRDRLAKLNEELQAQNEELIAQEEELRAQSDELTARNQALTETSRAKTQFLATMSHELRTPLNAVIGFSEILLDGTYGQVTERQATALHHVHDAGRHLLMLIDDLLDLSKVEAGQIALSMGSIGVADAISEAVTLVAGGAEKKQIRLEVQLAPQLRVRGDRARIRQIALNLISNAIKFTPDGGAVAVTATARGDRLRISVRDTGIGIRPNDASKLFKPFSQIDTGDRRRYGGTGLGLSISKHLVELMDGAIGYSSEPGAGSTFWFELPVAGASTSSAQIPRAATSRPSAPPRVLVVEDSATDATMIEASLAQAGYEVRVARDAELALQSLESFAPALAVVDLALPGMSGHALIEQLRADPRYRSLPIAVLTGRDLDGEERVALESRVQFVARKGISSRVEFLARVAAIVPPADGAVQKQLVLVVDDNDVNRSVACAMVEALGYEAIDAADAATGIRLARERGPAVILMDIEMPGMNGIEATRRLRRDEQTEKIPVIALTAHAMAGDAERFLAAGCNDYVSKPFGRAALRRALLRALGMSDG